MLVRLCLLRGPKCTRRGPAGRNVCKMERIEHGPQNIALGAQRRESLLLFLAGARVFYHPGARVLGILRRLLDPRLIAVKSRREPGLLLTDAIHSPCTQL